MGNTEAPGGKGARENVVERKEGASGGRCDLRGSVAGAPSPRPALGGPFPGLPGSPPGPRGRGPAAPHSSWIRVRIQAPLGACGCFLGGRILTPPLSPSSEPHTRIGENEVLCL